MSDSIRFKRGPKSQLKVLGLGEPGLTTDPDDLRLYIGGVDGNIPIPNMNDIANSDDVNKKLKVLIDSDKNQNVIFYVDQLTGNDNNNGLSKTAPFKTLEKAISTIPYLSEYGYTITLLSDYEVTSNIVFNSRYINSGLTLTGDGGNSKITIKCSNQSFIYFNYVPILSISNLIIEAKVGIRNIVCANISDVDFNHNGDAALSTWNSNVEIRKCNITSDTKCVYAMQTSNINFREATVLNGAGTGIHTTRGSVASIYTSSALTNNCTTKRTIAIGSSYIDYTNEDSGWIDFSSTINSAMSGVVRARKIGNQVFLDLSFIGKVSENEVMAKIPSGYLPSSLIYSFARFTGAFVTLYIKTSGEIILDKVNTGTLDSSSRIKANINYLIN